MLWGQPVSQLNETEGTHPPSLQEDLVITSAFASLAGDLFGSVCPNRRGEVSFSPPPTFCVAPVGPMVAVDGPTERSDASNQIAQLVVA